MRDIDLPEFDTLGDFFDFHDIVKLHVEQDSSWDVEIERMENMVSGQVQQFMEHPTKDRTMLQQLSTRIVKYQARVVEIREIIWSLMEQHRFLYAKTCEDLFIKWSEYKKSHPLK
jgi:hypothetical protein